MIMTETSKESTAPEKSITIHPWVFAGIRVSGYDAITNLICNEYNLTKDELLSQGRKNAWPRQLMTYLCYMHIDGQTLSEIGFKCGKRDHATVLHCKKKILNECEIYKDVYAEVHALELKVVAMKKLFLENQPK